MLMRTVGVAWMQTMLMVVTLVSLVTVGSWECWSGCVSPYCLATRLVAWRSYRSTGEIYVDSNDRALDSCPRHQRPSHSPMVAVDYDKQWNRSWQTSSRGDPGWRDRVWWRSELAGSCSLPWWSSCWTRLISDKDSIFRSCVQAANKETPDSFVFDSNNKPKLKIIYDWPGSNRRPWAC